LDGAAYWIVRWSLSSGAHSRDPFADEDNRVIGVRMTSEPQKLIVLSGLPGSGKSTLAEGLSRILSVPVFSIEAAMWRGGLARTQTGIAAYEVAIALADEHLRLGHSVIIDAVNPVEAPRAAWRSLAAKHRADLKIIECVCADETVYRHRVEARIRSIDGMPEIAWARVLERRTEYQPWADARLTLDTSVEIPERLLAEALSYLRPVSSPLAGKGTAPL
jgi:predicted kinase